jgi:hypothetical protein
MEETNCKSCGLTTCKCDAIEDRIKYGDPTDWYQNEY